MPKTVSASVHSVESEGPAISFSSVFPAQFFDSKLDSAKEVSIEASLNFANLKSDMPGAELVEGLPVATAAHDDAANINRSPSDERPSGGNILPANDAATKRATPLAHLGQIATNHLTESKPATSKVNLFGQGPVQHATKGLTGHQPQVPSSIPKLGLSTISPRITSIVAEQRTNTESLDSQVASPRLTTDDPLEIINAQKEIALTIKPGNLQNLAVLSSSLPAAEIYPTSANQLPGDASLKIGIQQSGTQAVEIITAASSHASNTVSNPDTGIDDLSATAWIASASIEQPRSTQTVQHAQLPKHLLIADTTTDADLSPGRTSIDSLASSLSVTSAHSGSFSNDKRYVRQLDSVGGLINTQTVDAHTELNSETLGFGSTQQPAPASHLISKSGQSHYLGVAQFHDPQFSRNVNDQLLLMAGQGVHKAHISLNPQELGPIEIRLSVVDDEVSVQLASVNPNVRESLEQAMPRLREMFNEAGLKLGEHDVSSAFDDGKASRFTGSERESNFDDSLPTEPELEKSLPGLNNESAAGIDTYI